MKVLELLQKLEDIMENASLVPFSSKIMVDQEDVLDLIEDIRLNIPLDLKDAIKIKEEERVILENSRKQGDKIVRQAERKMRELIDSDEITRSAYNKAQALAKSAQTEALQLRVGSIDYSATVLKNIQDELRDMINVIEDNKVELKELRKSTINNKGSFTSSNLGKKE